MQYGSKKHNSRANDNANEDEVIIPATTMDENDHEHNVFFFRITINICIPLPQQLNMSFQIATGSYYKKTLKRKKYVIKS